MASAVGMIPFRQIALQLFNESNSTDMSEYCSELLCDEFAMEGEKLCRVHMPSDRPGPHCWFVDYPVKKVSLEVVQKLGVFYEKLDHSLWEEGRNVKLEQICRDRGYTFRDFVDSSKISNLEEKLDHFRTEHLHDDDEVRFFLDGSGYFDIKNENDKFIRIHCFPGDLISLPRGIYHRFMPDDNMSFRVMRLFQGEPVWTPYNRSDPTTESRRARPMYLRQYIPAKAPPEVYLLDEPQVKIPLEALPEIGVFYKKLDPALYEADPQLEEMCFNKKLTFRDFVNSEKIPNLTQKMDTFKIEHLHDDDEIRYFIRGTGYFDVRDLKDRWVRIHCGPGDFLVLPAGIYHRFVPDEKMYFYVMRLFMGEPVWTPHSRALPETEMRYSREQYVKTVLGRLGLNSEAESSSKKQKKSKAEL